MKLRKDYAKKPFSFLVIVTTLPSDNQSIYYKSAVSQKINTKAKNDLARKTVKILAVPSRNIDKCKSFAGEDVVPEKGLLQKAAIIKIFEFLP